MSLTFLLPLLAGIARGTLMRQPDEGTAAHLFQIYVPLDVVLIAWFAAAWLPKRGRSAMPVVALQLTALLSVLAIVFLRHL